MRLDYAEINETTRVIQKLTNDTITDDTESLGPSYIYVMISVSASLFMTVGMSVIIIVICIHHVRKRRRMTLGRNLERHYETVNEPLYETVLNQTHHDTDSKKQMWSDFNTNSNEAYQKPNDILCDKNYPQN